MLQDLKYGVRMFVRNPGFACVVALTLALGIGANTVIFSFANVLLLRPLPIRDADRVGWIRSTNPLTHDDRAKTSLPDYAAFRDAGAFESLSGYRTETHTLTGRDDAERVFGYGVIGDLHHVWGLRALIGRTLTSSDEKPGAPRVAVLSHRYWSRRFGAAPSIVGDRLILDGEPHEVAGVLAPDIEIGT